jgi:hypothetical protein
MVNLTERYPALETKVKLFVLWVFVLINMAYADILSLMDSTSPIRSVMAGNPLPDGGLLMGAILMETAIAMVILTWVLPHKANRLINIIFAVLNIIAVVTGGHGAYYLFFASLEVAAMLLIIWYSWMWKLVKTVVPVK